MRKTLFLFLISSFSLSAQRFAYVDTEYILDNLPEYREAQKIIANKSSKWQAELDQKETQLKLDLTYFESERILLTFDQIREKEKEILTQQKKISDYKIQIFGPEGKLITARKGLVLPIQTRIWESVTKIAKKRDYNFVFDKGNGVSIIVSDPKYDISKAVLNLLTLKNNL